MAYLVIRVRHARRARRDDFDQARRLFESFHAFKPPELLRQSCRREIPDVLVKLGRLRGLIYTSDKGRCGQPRTYVHFMETMPLLAHCIRVDEADLETIKQTETRVAHCPKSNAKLGHGVAPFAKMVAKGIQVGLGSDSVASNNTCDLLEEARFALLLARSGGSYDLNSDDILRAATSGGAHSLGLAGQVGELKEGLQADFAVVSLNGAHQIPAYGPAETLIFASSGRDVTMTVVAGREVYRDGRVMSVDEDRLRARMSEIARKLSA